MHVYLQYLGVFFLLIFHWKICKCTAKYYYCTRDINLQPYFGDFTFQARPRFPCPPPPPPFTVVLDISYLCGDIQVLHVFRWPSNSAQASRCRGLYWPALHPSNTSAPLFHSQRLLLGPSLFWIQLYIDIRFVPIFPQ